MPRGLTQRSRSMSQDCDKVILIETENGSSSEDDNDNCGNDKKNDDNACAQIEKGQTNSNAAKGLIEEESKLTWQKTDKESLQKQDEISNGIANNGTIKDTRIRNNNDSINNNNNNNGDNDNTTNKNKKNVDNEENTKINNDDNDTDTATNINNNNGKSNNSDKVENKNDHNRNKKNKNKGHGNQMIDDESNITKSNYISSHIQTNGRSIVVYNDNINNSAKKWSDCIPQGKLMHSRARVFHRKLRKSQPSEIHVRVVESINFHYDDSSTPKSTAVFQANPNQSSPSNNMNNSAENSTSITNVESKQINRNDVIVIADHFKAKEDTISFMLPLLLRLRDSTWKREKPRWSPRGLILAPTPARVQRIVSDCSPLVDALRMSELELRESGDIGLQFQKMALGSDFMVATPGRLVELLKMVENGRACMASKPKSKSKSKSKSKPYYNTFYSDYFVDVERNFDMKTIKYMVIADADEYCRLGQMDQVQNIVSRINQDEAQIIATASQLSKEVFDLVDEILKPPVITIFQRDMTECV